MWDMVCMERNKAVTKRENISSHGKNNFFKTKLKAEARYNEEKKLT